MAARKPARRTPARRTPPRPGPTARRVPAPSPRPFLTPEASPRRRAIERRSAVVLLFLRGLPRALPALLVLGVVAGGLALPGVAGAVCLVLAALVLVWLVYLSWPALSPAGRAIRVLVIAAVVVLALDRIT
ncbi:MAG TPA: DUF6703 family protein [Mycobacteriales bacterium]|nr:DUF6703 family protein [Mycobacteriales bacterium]